MTTVVDVGTWLAAAAAGLAGLAYLTRVVRRMFAGIAILERLMTQGDAIQRLLRKELQPNHGSSLKDDVNAITQSLHRAHERIDQVEGTLDGFADSQRHLWPAIEAVANARPPKHHDRHHTDHEVDNDLADPDPELD